MNPASSVLLTDLYQLTMLQGYHDYGMQETAVFEFFVRRLRPGREFLIAAGLEQALEFLVQARFNEDELEWLASTRRFSPAFLASLENLRFTGDVHAMAEGTVCFANEPILRVTAPMAQAQLVETRLINLLHLQTLIASKAARSVLMAPDKLLVDFGLRRAHGAEAGLLAARATHIAGFAGTSNVLAGQQFGIPMFGTMAHSFVQAHDDETLAFEHFAHAQPDNVVLLIDTWDTEAAARKVVELAPRLAVDGIRIKGVRIDSGDLAEHARRVRAILDAGGLRDSIIFVSGDLDEAALHDLVALEGGAAACEDAARELRHGVTLSEQVLHRVSRHGLGRGLEDPAGLGVHPLHAPLGVDHDDPVEDGVEHSLEIEGQGGRPRWPGVRRELPKTWAR